jgi:hypothetical protein
MPPLPSRQPVLATPPKTNSALLTDRALLALGGDPAFIADLLGDLSEEYTYRVAHDGVYAAKLWYVREVVRSTPHLVWNAIRRGTPTARARLAASILAVVVSFSVLTLAWLTRSGPPASLLVGGGLESPCSCSTRVGIVSRGRRCGTSGSRVRPSKSQPVA